MKCLYMGLQEQRVKPMGDDLLTEKGPNRYQDPQVQLKSLQHFSIFILPRLKMETYCVWLLSFIILFFLSSTSVLVTTSDAYCTR